MENTNIIRSLVPDLILPFERAEAKSSRFVHYTTAETAIQIIENEAIWLRNVGCMNDVEEVQLGIDAMFNNLGPNSRFGDSLWLTLDKFEHGLADKTKKLFDDWSHDLITNTYITCLSEHLKREDKLGRLSMWRSYANPNGVALVIKGERLFQEESPHGAFTVPMIYKSQSAVSKMLSNFVDQVSKNFNMFEKLTSEQLAQHIFYFLKQYTLAIKHIGFSEEREWRVVYRPAEDLLSPPIIKPKIVSIGGVVQKVFLLPLKNNADAEMVGMEIDDLLDRIIIGPTNFPLQMKRAFVELLSDNGVKDAKDKVVLSNIPLRV